MDILILYEHRNRELENSCLLATELEKRGYKVKIKCIYSLRHYFQKPRLVIAPHLYNDDQLLNFCKNYWMNNDSLISMQYEQVMTPSTRDGIHVPRGQVVNAQHLAWGQAQIDAYLSGGIKPENTMISGHIAMDLLQPEFESLFRTREEIANEFGLDVNKKWVMFISTFNFTMKTERELEELYEIVPSCRELSKYSIRAQQEIVTWLKRIANENKDIVIIYRRHPGEKADQNLLSLEKEVSNFRCIDKYSMRQWIKSCDLFYTWFSTSAVDAYFGKKSCYILRPEVLPYEYEIDIFHDADKITTYDEFVKSINNVDDFPISDEVIRYYYGHDKNSKWDFAFMKIADLCDEMLKNGWGKHTYNYGTNRFDMYNSHNIKKIVRAFGHCILAELCSVVRIRISPNLLKKDFFSVIAKYEKETYGYRKDIREYKRRFNSIVEVIHSKER